jgi:hypothetical protein
VYVWVLCNLNFSFNTRPGPVMATKKCDDDLLASLLQPLSVDEFFSTVWEEKPMLFPGAVKTACGGHKALSWDDMHSALLTLGDPSCCPPESTVLVFENQTPTQDYPTPCHAYLNGCSIVVNHMDKVWPAVNDLCQALGQRVPHCFANVRPCPLPPTRTRMPFVTDH